MAGSVIDPPLRQAFLAHGDQNPKPADVCGVANPLDVAEVDAFLAKEMNQMSIQERDRVLYDIHGVSEVITETPDLIEERLFELEVELHKIFPKPAYDQAMYSDPDYVLDTKFRLMFLRADLFDAKKAAARMVRYFRDKQNLFGNELLGKEIQLKDLNEFDRESLESGCSQFLPVRDMAGRTILYVEPKNGKCRHIENLVRVDI